MQQTDVTPGVAPWSYLKDPYYHQQDIYIPPLKDHTIETRRSSGGWYTAYTAPDKYIYVEK